MAQFDDTLEFIERVRDCASEEDICRALIDVTSQFGLTAVMAGTVPDPRLQRDEQRQHAILCEWPLEWLNRYVAHNYIEHDPVVAHMKHRPGPFFWRDAARKVPPTRNALAVMGDAGEYNLRDGLALPLATLEGTPVLISLGGERTEMSPLEFQIVSLVAVYALGAAMMLRMGHKKVETVALTARERECLRWAAAGKSEWEISQILGISEHTSEKHLLHAKTKLGAVNRTQAVAEAIRRGYIS